MQDIADKLEWYLSDAAEEDRFSGVVLFLQGGTMLLQASHNQACRRFGVPNHVDTRFDVASLGKMFTGVAIGQLVEQGLLSFDSALASYLPGYPPAVAEHITLHHLLTHTSGLGGIFDGGWEVASLARFRSIDDIIPYFQDRPLLFEPGTRWEYSNAGYVLLGAVIEAVTGESYFGYIQDHILVPAEMQDTGPYSLDQEVPKLAYAYTRLDPSSQIDTEPQWNNVYRHWTTSNPAGCVYSTVVDLLRFTQAFRGAALVSSSMMSILTEAKVPTGQRAGQYYGYGFFVDDLDTVRTYGHAGTIPGFQAWLDVYPAQDLTLIALTNFDHPAARDVAWLVRDSVLELRQ